MRPLRGLASVCLLAQLACSSSGDAGGRMPGPDGALADGGTVRLAGGDFGSKSPAPPVLFDRFEEGALASTISSPEVGPAWQLAAGDVTYDAAHAFSGSQAAMMDWTDATTWDNLAFVGGLDATEIYYSYRAYEEVYGGSDPAGWNFKHGAITSGDKDVYHGTHEYVSTEIGSGGTEDAYTVTGIDQATVSVFYANDAVAAFPSGGWHRLEHYVKLSTPAGAGNGKRYFKVDGGGNFTHSSAPGGHYASPSGAVADTAYDGDPLVTRASGTLTLQNVLLPFYLRPGYSARMWVDEVYVDRTQARVEFGDAATWDGCTKRFPQPATSWTPTLIEVTANQGTFAAGELVYGFVVRADGTIVALGPLGAWGG